MNFLYKLYEQQYFGIVLFIIIMILLLLFLIILFFGKKDQKEQLEKTKKLELANENTNKDKDGFKETIENTKELVIPEIEQPVFEQEVVKTPEVPAFEPVNVENTYEAKEDIDINGLFELPQTPEVPEAPAFEPKEEVFEPVKPNVEPKPVDAPFSSVYTEPKKEESVPFEMPKLMEMPKLKTEEETITNNIFEENKENNIFDSIENETYNIRK